MTQFINTRENIVTEAVDGLVAASGGKLARLDGYPHIRVVVRNDWDKSKVALIGRWVGPRTGACGFRRGRDANGCGMRRHLRLADSRRGTRRHPCRDWTVRLPAHRQELYR